MRLSRLVALLSLVAACAHADSFEQGVFRKGDMRVEMGPVPAGWRRVAVDGADLAFRDDAHEGSALFDVRCDVRDDDAPLTVLTDHLIMGTTQREVESQDVLPFDRREALHTRMHAKLDGVPMQYDIYVMKKDGCVYDLVYVADPAHFGEGMLDFERFAVGLRATEGHHGAGALSRDP